MLKLKWILLVELSRSEIQLFQCLVLCIFYGCHVWYAVTCSIRKFDKFQAYCFRLLFGCKSNYVQLHWQILTVRLLLQLQDSRLFIRLNRIYETSAWKLKIITKRINLKTYPCTIYLICWTLPFQIAFHFTSAWVLLPSFLSHTGLQIFLSHRL